MKIFGDNPILSFFEHNRDISPLNFVKSFINLNAGDSFKALVTDITPNNVTLRLSNGENLTARSLSPPDVHIGDETIFTVKDNSNNQILLEVHKPGADMVQNRLAGEALLNADIYPTKENIDIARALMDNKLPIDADTLQKALFFTSAGGLSLDKALFLIKENFPMTEKSVEMLNTFLDGTVRLTEHAGRLLDHLFSMPESDEKEAVLNKIAEYMSRTDAKPGAARRQSGEILREIHKSIFINMKRGDPAQLKDFYKRLHAAVSEAKTYMNETKPDDALGRLLTNIKDSLEFMDHIGNYKQYIQIPFAIDNAKYTGELYVFKEPKMKRGGSDESASVLIGLDLPALGRVEAFIVKDRHSLNFQFRSDTAGSLKLLGRKFDELKAVLDVKGYLVTGVAFKKIDEPFNVARDITDISKKPDTHRRYLFDIRV